MKRQERGERREERRNRREANTAFCCSFPSLPFPFPPALSQAMTAARVRSCPDCKKRFFKTEGCNKMTCACGTLSCYLCRSRVERTVGYKHFCQVSNCKHVKCGRCPLFSDSVDDDRMAMREAGMKAMELNQVRGGGGGGGGGRSE